MCLKHRLDLRHRENLLGVRATSVMAGGVVSLLINLFFASNVMVQNVV